MERLDHGNHGVVGSALHAAGRAPCHAGESDCHDPAGGCGGVAVVWWNCTGGRPVASVRPAAVQRDLYRCSGRAGRIGYSGVAARSFWQRLSVLHQHHPYGESIEQPAGGTGGRLLRLSECVCCQSGYRSTGHTCVWLGEVNAAQLSSYATTVISTRDLPGTAVAVHRSGPGGADAVPLQHRAIRLLPPRESTAADSRAPRSVCWLRWQAFSRRTRQTVGRIVAVEPCANVLRQKGIFATGFGKRRAGRGDGFIDRVIERSIDSTGIPFHTGGIII